MDDAVDVSIVVACYNEVPHLMDSIKTIMDVMEQTRYSFELILIDDCSKDNTREVIKEIALKWQDKVRYLFNEKNLGRGGTVTEGIRMGRGRMVGFLDIDLETHARYIPSCLLALENGYDVATAWRIYKLRIGILNRWALSRGYNWLMRKMLDVNLKDTETGFKFFNKQRILPILDEVKNTHWFWDTEIMALAYYKHLNIIEIPTLFVRREDKKSTVRVMPDVWGYLKSLISFRKRLKRERIL